MDFEMRGISMRVPSYNPRTGHEYEDDPQATTHEIMEFKKQYEALSQEGKARLPKWLRESIEKDASSN
jgi:hypothetical protein